MFTAKCWTNFRWLSSAVSFGVRNLNSIHCLRLFCFISYVSSHILSIQFVNYERAAAAAVAITEASQPAYYIYKQYTHFFCHHLLSSFVSFAVVKWHSLIRGRSFISFRLVAEIFFLHFVRSLRILFFRHHTVRKSGVCFVYMGCLCEWIKAKKKKKKNFCLFWLLGRVNLSLLICFRQHICTHMIHMIRFYV